MGRKKSKSLRFYLTFNLDFFINQTFANVKNKLKL
jgi:hypothetical protein